MEQNLRQLIDQLTYIEAGLVQPGYDPVRAVSLSEATMSQDTPTGRIPGIDQYTPSPGDYSMTKSNRMPPGEMPPGATPHPGNPNDLYVYKGMVFRKETGYQLTKDSPMLQAGWFDRYNTDQHGNKRGSYQKIDVVPVQADPGLASGGSTSEIDRIQKGLGRDMQLASSWEYRGATITLWYRPEGGQGEKWDDITQLGSAVGGNDWAKYFKSVGYSVRDADSFTRSNNLGNVLCSSVALSRAAQAWHFAGAAQKVAFKTAQGPGLAIVDTTFFGPESVWDRGGQTAWLQTLASVQLSKQVQPIK